MAGVVLHPRYKFAYFEEKWVDSQSRFVGQGRRRLRQVWESTYKGEPAHIQPSSVNELASRPKLSYLEQILNDAAPTSSATRPIPTGRRDQLH